MSELSKAIVQAADKNYADFKNIIGDELEKRFRAKIDDVSKEKANKLFNPDYEKPEENDEDDDENNQEHDEDDIDIEDLDDDEDDSPED